MRAKNMDDAEGIVLELILAGKAMIEGQGWHEVDGRCSICKRFAAAVETAQKKIIVALVCDKCGRIDGTHREKCSKGNGR